MKSKRESVNKIKKETKTVNGKVKGYDKARILKGVGLGLGVGGLLSGLGAVGYKRYKRKKLQEQFPGLQLEVPESESEPEISPFQEEFEWSEAESQEGGI